ncbi:MAG: DUF3945 domain-containing protein [Prolixibacteraceae bacterium]|nr:DUF3945 domain-containing protein [Prolixibacteraceae bacterium]
MEKYKIQDLSIQDFEALGLVEKGIIKLDQETQDSLMNGQVTNLIRLDKLKIEGIKNISLDAKLSLYKKNDGKMGLLVHPIYKERKNHTALTPEENKYFAQEGGIHPKDTAAYGKITRIDKAPFGFIDKNDPSFFVEIEKNGEKKIFWGEEIKNEVERCRHKTGDEIQITLLGEKDNKLLWNVKPLDNKNKKEESVLFEFDTDTNSFVSLNTSDLVVPDEVNGIPLSLQQKQRFKNGQPTQIGEDGPTIQASPTAKNNIKADRRILILSILVDGGISYLLYKGIQAIVQHRQMKSQNENLYSKGYMDALKKVQVDLERKQTRFPNDKLISKDINVVKDEMERLVPGGSYKGSIEEQGVNDPELEQDADQRINKNTEKEINTEMEKMGVEPEDSPEEAEKIITAKTKR